jgi:hypothetical protein
VKFIIVLNFLLAFAPTANACVGFMELNSVIKISMAQEGPQKLDLIVGDMLELWPTDIIDNPRIVEKLVATDAGNSVLYKVIGAGSVSITRAYPSQAVTMSFTSKEPLSVRGMGCSDHREESFRP